MPYGCFGFLPIKLWLLTIDRTRLNHLGLKIFFFQSSHRCCRMVQGIFEEAENLFIFPEPASRFRPIYLIYPWCHVVHHQPVDLLSVGSSFWRLCPVSDSSQREQFQNILHEYSSFI